MNLLQYLRASTPKTNIIFFRRLGASKTFCCCCYFRVGKLWPRGFSLSPSPFSHTVWVCFDSEKIVRTRRIPWGRKQFTTIVTRQVTSPSKVAVAVRQGCPFFFLGGGEILCGGIDSVPPPTRFRRIETTKFLAAKNPLPLLLLLLRIFRVRSTALYVFETVTCVQYSSCISGVKFPLLLPVSPLFGFLLSSGDILFMSDQR